MDTKQSHQVEQIQRAVKILGSKAALARAVSKTQPLIWQWCAGRRPVSARHCLLIEKATAGQVTRYDLRPDVFGEPSKKRAA